MKLEKPKIKKITMDIYFGNGKTKYGPGVQIDLTGKEIVTAIKAYLVSQNVYISGAATFTINGELIKIGGVYIDPSGYLINDGEKYSGGGKFIQKEKTYRIYVDNNLITTKHSMREVHAFLDYRPYDENETIEISIDND